MICPACDGADTRVIDSRLAGDGRATRRRRECAACTHRFTTYERIEQPPILVVKRGGQREQYERTKLTGGLLKALHRRPVALQTVERFVRELEGRIREQPRREISSRALGEAVLGFLRQLDNIAYIRYASVHHDFADIDQLLDAVRDLVDSESRPAPEDQ